MIGLTEVRKGTDEHVKLAEEWHTAEGVVHLGVGVVFVLLDLNVKWFEQHPLTHLYISRQTEVHYFDDVHEQELSAI